MSWKTVSSQKKAAFPLFQVYEDQVKLPNGLELDYYWVDKTPAVAMLPVIEDSIVMVKQYRYPIKSESLELPAGHKNSDETPEECRLLCWAFFKRKLILTECINALDAV